VRVLFSAETPLSLTSYLSVIDELGARGHQVVVAVHEERDVAWLDRLLAEVGRPHVTVERAVAPGDRWLELSADVRSSLDLLRFLGPRFNETYRARAWRRAPRAAAALARGPLGRTSGGRRVLTGGLRMVERAIPTNAEIERYLRERGPDVVLFTPYLGLRTVQPDFLRAAQALGLRTAILVKSWDNLSSKSVVRPVPDRLFVWNEIQREEAEQLHGIPPARVVVTGAQCFDEWFTWQPRPREDFLRRLGLDPGRPYVLYACSVPWTGQSEVAFVRRWAAALRAAGGSLADLQVVVRPHPKRAADWADADLSGLPGVVVFPAEGQAPTDRASRADFFDSIHHSAAVVGLNTSMMIEAAIVGRPVLTVLDPEFDRVQRGTLHFAYLLEVGGGLVRVAHTLDEHTRQLAESVAGEDDADERARAFVARFVRPHGLDVPATPRFVDEIERLAAAAPPRPKRTPASLLPLRPLLAPLATRAGRYAPVADS
jgi:predicted glycosyltransferase